VREEGLKREEALWLKPARYVLGIAISRLKAWRYHANDAAGRKTREKAQRQTT